MEHPLQTWIERKGIGRKEFGRRVPCVEQTLSEVFRGLAYFGRKKALQVVLLTGGEVTLADLYTWEPPLLDAPGASPPPFDPPDDRQGAEGDPQGAGSGRNGGDPTVPSVPRVVQVGTEARAGRVGASVPGLPRIRANARGRGEGTAPRCAPRKEPRGEEEEQEGRREGLLGPDR